MIESSEARGLLEAERKRLRRLLGWAEDSIRGHERQSVMESSPRSGDDEYADNATETYSMELDATLRQRFAESLASVDAALQRLAAGEYGRCARCGEVIPVGRLRAVPQIPFCARCGQEQEVEG